MNEDWILVGRKHPQRRYREVCFKVDMLEALLSGEASTLRPLDLVPDAQIVGIKFSSWRGSIICLFSSESFAPVPESESVPEWAPAFVRLTTA